MIVYIRIIKVSEHAYYSVVTHCDNGFYIFRSPVSSTPEVARQHAVDYCKAHNHVEE